MEVNVNLATMYFCEQRQMSQIKFQELLAKPLIYNNHCNEGMDEMPDKKVRKVGDSSCSPYKKFGGHESSLQTVHIHNTSAQPAKKGYVPIAFVPQVSISVWDAWYHLACSKNS